MEGEKNLSPNIDKLLLQASDIYELISLCINLEDQSRMKPTTKCRFAKPVTFESLKERLKNSVPVKTKQQTDWNVRLWMEWRLNRINIAESI